MNGDGCVVAPGVERLVEFAVSLKTRVTSMTKSV